MMKYLFKDFSRGPCLFFSMAFFVVLGLSDADAQSLRRQSIGISGANMVSNGLLVKQSVGQPYATATYYENGLGFRPGFQQPVSSVLRTIIGKELSSSNLQLQLYPNPATSSVRIESAEEITNGILKVMDSHGRLVVNQPLSDVKGLSLNCENWMNGLYLISVSTEGRVSYSSKLIISK